MSRPTTYRPGQFSWVDLMTPDAKAAKRFYGTLLGWTFEDRTSDHGVYTMFHWNELVSRDVDGAHRFYGELFGWEFRSGGEESGGYVEIRLAGRANGGILPWQPEMGDMPPRWSVYFSVADCDASVKQLRELGGAVFVEPRDLPVGRFAVVTDPQGAAFQLIHLLSPE